MQIQRKARLGTTTVEMAIVLPMMFSIVVGGMQIFRYYAVSNNIELAVMEGARHGILSDSTAQDAIDTTNQFLNRAGINASVNATRGINGQGELALNVSVTSGLSSNGFLLPCGSLFTMSRQCDILCEGN